MRSAFKEINGIRGFVRKVSTQNNKIKFLGYRFRWRYFPKFRIVGRFPVHVDIETTNRCNLKCVMCPHSFPTPEFTKGLGSMNIELAKQIIDEGCSKGLAAIKLNWRGEPLLWKGHLAQIIRYAKKGGIIDVIINTNGLLLDEELSRELISAGLDQIIFSVDGNSPQTYEKIRRGGDFNKVVKNIEGFLKVRDSLKLSKPFVRVQMVKVDNNIHEVESFIKRWSPLVDSITFQDYTNRGEDAQRLNTADDKFEKVARLACPQIWQRLVVTRDGKVVMCCRDWESENVLGKLDYSSGKNLEYFWKSDKLNNVRRLHLQGRVNDIPVCLRCSYKESFQWRKRKKAGQ